MSSWKSKLGNISMVCPRMIGDEGHAIPVNFLILESSITSKTFTSYSFSPLPRLLTGKSANFSLLLMSKSLPISSGSQIIPVVPPSFPSLHHPRARHCEVHKARGRLLGNPKFIAIRGIYLLVAQTLFPQLEVELKPIFLSGLES